MQTFLWKTLATTGFRLNNYLVISLDRDICLTLLNHIIKITVNAIRSTSQKGYSIMSDVVLLEIIKTGFWLTIISGGVLIFQKEVKKLLQSLGSFKVAGSTFEFKDKQETVHSYSLLAETLIDLLSRADRLDDLQKLISSSQIEKLGVFALKYTNEMPKSSWNEELLRNIAYLLLRFGRYKQSTDLYDALLAGRPDHYDLLNLKALALMTSRMPNNVQVAEEILSGLVARYPEIAVAHFNLSLVKSLLAKDDEAAQEMKRVIQLGFWKENKNILEDPMFHHTREHRIDLIDSLTTQLDEAISTGSNA